MKASIKNIEQTIASEQYRPALSEEYQELFQRLTRRLEDTLPMNRARIISDELRRVSETAREADLDCQKYMAALSVLVDLSLQGWIFDFQDHQLTLRMENDNIDDKEKIRYRLSAERNAQFKSESVARFIKYMETERNYNGTPVSVKCLIGNRDALILAIRTGRQVCAPYIQMVTGSRDEYTGFKLSDIWRYFRYTWSIPYKTMPGRNIYYLVRDSLQPYHPIIGIFALGNSVLNLTARDDDIGWTIEAIKTDNMLNDLFAGEYNVSVRRNIAFVDFENTESSEKVYKGIDDFLGKDYTLITIGSSEVQAILANTVFTCEAGPLNPAFQDEAVASPQATYEANVVGPVQEETAWPEHSPVAPDTAHAYVADAPSTPVAPAAPVTNETDTELQRTDLREKCARINKVFRDYGINAYPVDPNMVQEAARFTRFSVELKSGETIRTLERFKTDIGIQLEANGEILIDHIKGTKYLSVDVPFAGAGKAISLLKHLNLLDGSSGALDFVAGQKADGRFEVVDIAKAPHMLIAGTTGSGKTIFLYSIIVSLLHKYPMEDLEFLIIDPKQTDFVFFEDLPNLYGGHVVVDAEEALEMIQRINDVDKEGRMQQLRFCRSRDIGSYNEKNPDHRMKRLIIIIDEYADLIQTAEMQGKRKEFEKFLSMLAQKVRSLGIHLIIATQRPSANIVTGVLKANIPYRISFRLPSHTDSQTILDMPGAENLLGKGDMLMVTDSDTIRMQGLYISEDELDNFVKSRQ